MRIYDRIIDGQLSDRAAIELAAELATHCDKDICISVQRKRKKRSLSQNAYYFGVVIPMCKKILEEYGNDCDDEEVHSFLKEHVGKLTGSIVDAKGRKAITKSSATLSTTEFENYLMRITVWAATEGVIIPQPNEDLIPTMESYNV
jgi:predicted HD phosphohydrolase